MSACLAMSGTFAAIFSFEASKKWIIRDGGKGISPDRVRRADRQGLEEVSGVPHGREATVARGPSQSGRGGTANTAASVRVARPAIILAGTDQRVKGGNQHMAVAPELLDKTDEQRAITEMVRQFVDEQIIPNAEHYDHEDEFPEPIVEQMKELGLFGVTIPEEYGGMGLDLTTYAMIVEELSRGWISISGVVNTHFIGSYLLMKFGTDEQKEHFLPQDGDRRDPGGLLAVGARGRLGRAGHQGDRHQGRRRLGPERPEDVGHERPAVERRVRPDEERHQGRPALQGHDLLHHREGAGRGREHRRATPASSIPPKIKKMGYKGVESTELVYDGYRCPPDRILGGEEAGLGQGFRQMMDALEVGRVNVAARGVGIAQRALELALRYSQERKTFGKPIAQHQAIQFKLADMATKVEAARLLTFKAARMKDAGQRSDVEAGMAKLFASEAGKEVVEDVVPHPRRLRLLEGVRDRAPLPRRAAAADRRGHVSEIQRMVIGKKLLERHKI